jgi:hypothetical protein
MAERTIEFDPQQRKRQLRRRAIVLAKLQGSHYADRWLPAKAFLVVRDDNGVAVEGEEEALEVLEHLIELRLVEEWQPMGMNKGTGILNTGSPSLSQRRFRLTDRGYALWAQELDPIPSIADERLGD